MSIIDQAWAILKKVVPSMELEEFIQKLKPIFEKYEHLSPDEVKKKKAEIKTKMLEYIKSDKQTFGEPLSEGAQYILKEKPPLEEKIEVVKCYSEKREEDLEKLVLKQKTITDQPSSPLEIDQRSSQKEQELEDQ